MISNAVRKEIDRAKVFGERIESIVVNKGQFPNGDRDLFLLGYWALVFDFHKGILVLLDAEHSGSAYALVRPVIEAVVRAHVALKCSDEVLLQLKKDKYKVNFTTIGATIAS